MGYRDAAFSFITIISTLVLYLVALFLFGVLVPPVYKKVEGRKAFDKVSSLFGRDKPEADKKH